MQEEIPAPQISLEVIKLALPMMLSFTFTASQLAVSGMIANINKENADDYLAAANLVTTVTSITAGLSVSSLYAMSIKASKQYGKLSGENRDKAQRKIADIFKGGTAISLAILPLAFSSLYFSKSILTHGFRQDEHIAELASQFLSQYAFAFLPLMFRITAEQIMFAFKKAIPAMLIALSSFGAGTALAYFLAFGPYKLGLAGIAYGYIAEAVLTCLGFNLYLGFNEAFRDIHFFRFFQQGSQLFKQAIKLLKMGLPITVQMGCELSAGLLMSIFAGWISKDAQAAQNFSTQLLTFAVLPSITFGQTVTQEVGRLMGKQDFKNAQRFARYGLLTTLGVITAICMPVGIMPERLVSLLSPAIGERALKLAKNILPLAATRTVYDTLSYGMTQVSRAAKDPYAPTLIKTACLWLGMLGGYLLGFNTFLGIYGLEIGFLLGVALGAMLLFPRWLGATAETNLSKPKTPLENNDSIFKKCCSCLFFKQANIDVDVNKNIINYNYEIVESPTSSLSYSNSTG